MKKSEQGVSEMGIDWNNVNLKDSYERSRNILEPYSFDILLLEVECNLRDVNAATVTAQFESILQAKVAEAREIFAANLENIVVNAQECRAEQ